MSALFLMTSKSAACGLAIQRLLAWTLEALCIFLNSRVKEIRSEYKREEQKRVLLLNRKDGGLAVAETFHSDYNSPLNISSLAVHSQ